MRLWIISFVLLLLSAASILMTAMRVADGELRGAGTAWIAAVLGLASLVAALLSLRRRVD